MKPLMLDLRFFLKNLEHPTCICLTQQRTLCKSHVCLNGAYDEMGKAQNVVRHVKFFGQFTAGMRVDLSRKGLAENTCSGRKFQ